MNNTVRTILIVALGAIAMFMFFNGRKGTEGAHASLAVEAQAPVDGRRPEQRFHVRTALTAAGAGLDATVTTRSGALRALDVLGAQFQIDGHPLNLTSTDKENTLPLYLRTRVTRDGQAVVPAYIDFEGRQVSDREVQLTWSSDDHSVEVVRTIRGGRPFVLDIETRVVNHGAAVAVEHQLPVYSYVLRDHDESGMIKRPWQVGEAMCRHGDTFTREQRTDLVKRDPGALLAGDARFAAIGNLYFTMAMVPADNDVRCRIFAEERAERQGGDPVGAVYAADLAWNRRTVERDQSTSFRATAYFGPKEDALLRAATPDGRLNETVNLGFFSFIARQLVKVLKFFFGITHNWGVAIILLTLCVRVVLLPLLQSSMRSMVAMQRIKPELDEIQKRLGDNQEARALAQMELYKKHKINPVSGCLPQFAQLPIWWALYTTLQTSVELFHAPFALWWRDLSAPDPFYALPLVLGAIMFVQQKLMPPQGMDPVQAKMMTYFFPVFLTVISLMLPSGLALYMLCNSVLGIGQQWYVKRQMDTLRSNDPSGIVVKPAGGGS